MKDDDFIPGDWIVHRVDPLATVILGMTPDGPITEPDRKLVCQTAFLLENTPESLMVYMPALDKVYGLPKALYPSFRFATPTEVEASWSQAELSGVDVEKVRPLCEELNRGRGPMTKFFQVNKKLRKETKKGGPSRNPFDI